MEQPEINDILDKMITSIESGKKYKRRKSVSYNDVLSKHHFIINREDINAERLKPELWWSPADFLEFFNQARYELSYFMIVNPHANKYKYSKTLWYDLDFDKIYNYVIMYGIVPVELVKVETNK